MDRYLLGSLLRVEEKRLVSPATLSLIRVREYSRWGSPLHEQTLDMGPDDIPDVEAKEMFIEVGSY